MVTVGLAHGRQANHQVDAGVQFTVERQGSEAFSIPLGKAHIRQIGIPSLLQDVIDLARNVQYGCFIQAEIPILVLVGFQVQVFVAVLVAPPIS